MCRNDMKGVALKQRGMNGTSGMYEEQEFCDRSCVSGFRGSSFI